jgi:glycosyltransferase involved in cell wall biosynthesis
LEITSNFDPKIGGQERHVLTLCRHLTNLGHNVTVLTCGSYPGYLCKDFRISNLDSYNLIGLRLISARKFKKFLMENNFDICHLHHSTIFGETILFSNLSVKLPVVTTLHTQMNRNLFAKFFFDRLSLKLIGTSSNKVICLSPSIKQSLIKRGLEASKCVSIPNALEINSVENQLSEICKCKINDHPNIDVLFVGRLEKRKGIQWLLEAIILLHRKGVKCKLQIIGHGPLLNHLRKRANEENIQKYVDFSGYVSREELYKSYLKTKVVVIPSIYEGVPTVALEAMTANTPLIVTDIPGLKELVMNEINGLVVPPKDSRSLSIAIEKILVSPGSFHSMSKYNKRTLADYSWDVIVKRIIHLYQETIDSA